MEDSQLQDVGHTIYLNLGSYHLPRDRFIPSTQTWVHTILLDTESHHPPRHRFPLSTQKRVRTIFPDMSWPHPPRQNVTSSPQRQVYSIHADMGSLHPPWNGTRALWRKWLILDSEWGQLQKWSRNIFSVTKWVCPKAQSGVVSVLSAVSLLTEPSVAKTRNLSTSINK